MNIHFNFKRQYQNLVASYIYSYLNFTFNLCLGKVLIMGGEKHNHCWIHVTKVENGCEWICKHCNLKFSGGASSIEAHLGLGGVVAHRSSKVGEDIRRFSNHHVTGNEGVHNNLASTSSNPPEAVNRSIHSIQVQGK